MILLFRAKRARFVFTLKFLLVLLNEQFFAPKVNPRYLNVFTFSIAIPFINKFILHNLFPRLNTIHLVFASLMNSFFSCKKELSLSIFSWSSPCDLARTIKSSAYMRAFAGLFSDRCMGESLARFNMWMVSLMYNLNRRQLVNTFTIYARKHVEQLRTSCYAIFCYILSYVLNWPIKSLYP